MSVQNEAQNTELAEGRESATMIDRIENEISELRKRKDSTTNVDEIASVTKSIEAKERLLVSLQRASNE